MAQAPLAYRPQANYTDRSTTAAGEVSANFCGWRVFEWSLRQIPSAVKLCFLDQSCYSFFQVAP
jgi:hypothetical protein